MSVEKRQSLLQKRRYVRLHTGHHSLVLFTRTGSGSSRKAAQPLKRQTIADAVLSVQSMEAAAEIKGKRASIKVGGKFGKLGNASKLMGTRALSAESARLGLGLRSGQRLGLTQPKVNEP